LTSGTAQLAVAPGSGVLGSIQSLTDAFDLYKVQSLEYRIHPGDSQTVSQSLAYYPENDVQASTITANAENPDCVLITPRTTTPSSWHRVPFARLKGQIDWYKCVADASTAEFEQQGVLVLTGTAAEVVAFEVRGIVHLRNPVDSSTLMQRVKEKVLASLATRK
jgi:hypothetical protein